MADPARPAGLASPGCRMVKVSHRQRRVLALIILCVGLPVYIVVAVTLVGMLDRPPVLIEFGIYALAGIAWALPLRAVFRGIGAADPDSRKTDE